MDSTGTAGGLRPGKKEGLSPGWPIHGPVRAVHPAYRTGGCEWVRNQSAASLARRFDCVTAALARRSPPHNLAEGRMSASQARPLNVGEAGGRGVAPTRAWRERKVLFLRRPLYIEPPLGG